jgi:hypothetical protein
LVFQGVGEGELIAYRATDGERLEPSPLASVQKEDDPL